MLKCWRSKAVPWRANRTEIQGHVWYVILDTFGHELFTSEKVKKHDEDGVLKNVATMLAKVNGNSLVNIDGSFVEVMWREA